MKKRNDLGLEHVLKLGIRAARDGRGILNELAKEYGRDIARKKLDAIFEVAEKDGKEQMYEVKNAEYNLAMIFSGCYDADIVRKTCNWIAEHKEYFGDTILEIGCDCGFMTTFLGTMFPEKHITAIERSKNGIEIARKNAERFGLNNIEFLNVDAFDLRDRVFDTVFSMRTMQENGSSAEPEDPANELIPQAEIFTRKKSPYAVTLSELVKDGGHLVSIERLNRNALFLAWLQALNDAGMRHHLDAYSEIQCVEVGDDTTLEAMVFSKGDTSGVDVFMEFMNCVAQSLDTGAAQYVGWDAKIMYEATGGPMVRGYEITDMRNHAILRVAVKVHKYDDTCLLLYQNNNGNVHIGYHDISQKDRILEEIMSSLEDAKQVEYIKITEL